MTQITKKVSLYEARRRKEVALATVREIEAAKLKGELVDVQELTAKLVRIGNAMRGIIEAVPGLTEDEKTQLCDRLAEVAKAGGEVPKEPGS